MSAAGTMCGTHLLLPGPQIHLGTVSVRLCQTCLRDSLPCSNLSGFAHLSVLKLTLLVCSYADCAEQSMQAVCRGALLALVMPGHRACEGVCMHKKSCYSWICCRRPSSDLQVAAICSEPNAPAPASTAHLLGAAAGPAAEVCSPQVMLAQPLCSVSAGPLQCPGT